MWSTKSIYLLWLICRGLCTLAHEADFFYIHDFVIFKSNLALQWATWDLHHNDDQDYIVISLFVCKSLHSCFPVNSFASKLNWILDAYTSLDVLVCAISIIMFLEVISYFNEPIGQVKIQTTTKSIQHNYPSIKTATPLISG